MEVGLHTIGLDLIIIKISSGIHLTSNAYVATYLLKDLTATEYTGELNSGKLRNQTNRLKLNITSFTHNAQLNDDFLNVYFQNIYKD